MGPYGSVWAHVKTGRSPMAHGHFQTPPDPKRGPKNPKMIKKLYFLTCPQLVGTWVQTYVSALFGVRRGLKMILSHRAPSSLNMSSYRAIWTHFRQHFIFVCQQISDPEKNKLFFWQGSDFVLQENMKFGLKLIHMARYQLILRLHGTPWLRIIFKPLLTPQWDINI